jgi:hypothetical protein
MLKNKPLLDVFRDRGRITVKATGLSFDLSTLAPTDTQIFVLSPEVALAAETMVRSKSFRMPEVADMRFPYPHMAIEVPLTEEVRKLRVQGTEGTHPITRIGIYVHSDAEEGWVNCFPYWEYKDITHVEPPVFTYTLGMDDLPFPNVGVGTPVNPDDVKYFKIVPSPCLVKAYMEFGAPPERLQDLYKHPEFMKLLGENVSELPTLLFACSLLLTCKSGITKTNIAAVKPPPGLSLGAKKKKQYSASPYTLLHLSEIETVTANGAINHRADIAAHYVRGHFKQRSSGLYWWNSFIRGSGIPRRRVAYSVEQ